MEILRRNKRAARHPVTSADEFQRMKYTDAEQWSALNLKYRDEKRKRASRRFHFGCFRFENNPSQFYALIVAAIRTFQTAVILIPISP
jgi:hypothetical protein